MRKYLIPLLMVSAALPSVANAQWRNLGRDNGERPARTEQDNSRAERPQRVERPERVEQPQRIERQQVEQPRFEPREQMQRQQVQRRDYPNNGRPNNGQDRSFGDALRAQAQRQQVERQQQEQQRAVQDARTNNRGNWDNQRRGWDGYRDRVINQGQVVTQNRGRDDDDRRWRDNNNAQRWANRDGSWSNRWRSDNRYDWQRYRSQNRSIFRIGFYSDPYGYNYRRYNVGYNLWPNYYQSNYWISDPWMYRLPQVWGPYRWVRYYDDALLVNIYTGQVEDVLYNFFW